MPARPLKWAHIVREHYKRQRAELSANDQDSDVLCCVVDWREHQAGLVVTVEHWDSGMVNDVELDIDDPRASRYENYLISWRTVASLAIELQSRPPKHTKGVS